MKKDKIIIFDFDGVIADSFDIALEISQMSKPTLTKKRYRQAFNGNITKAIYEDRVIKEVDFEKEYDKKFETLLLADNIKTAIQNLSKDFKLFIVSSTINKTIEKYLLRHGIIKCFTEILGSDVEASKVKKFKMIFDKYLSDPTDSIFITDSSGDIKEAKEAKIGYIVGILGGYQTKKSLENAKPDKIAKDFDDFFRIVVSLINKKRVAR
jgi:phosphoglycolate phosphatase